MRKMWSVFSGILSGRPLSGGRGGIHPSSVLVLNRATGAYEMPGECERANALLSKSPAVWEEEPQPVAAANRELSMPH